MIKCALHPKKYNYMYIKLLIIYVKKLLDSDWLIAV